LSNKWDVRFLQLAETISTWSKDPSSKIGAVAIGDKRQVLATGYNGFPRNISDHAERLEDREEKYKYVVHAEMNTIYNATYNGVSLDGATLYVHGLPVCAHCALGVVQVGIKRVVMTHGIFADRWVESFKTTSSIFGEAGVDWEFIRI